MKSFFLLLFVIWFIIIVAVDYMYPANVVPFKNYDFSKYNIIDRRQSHLKFVHTLLENKINFLFFILSFYILLIIYPIIVFFGFFFTIFWLIYISYTLYYKKIDFILNFNNHDSSPFPCLKSLFWYTFYSQPCYSGCNIAYNVFKKYYKQSEKLNVWKFFLARVKIYTIGFSYFFLALVKELTLCFIFSYNDYKNTNKKKNIYIWYRFFINDLFTMHYSIFNNNKLAVKKLKIICGSLIIFNPPRLSSVIRPQRSLSYNKVNNIINDLGTGGTKSYNSKVRHLSLTQDGVPEEAAIYTSNALDNSQVLYIYGSKKNTGIVTNTLVNPNDLSSNRRGLHHIEESAGTNDHVFLDQTQKGINVFRQLSSSNDPVIIQPNARDRKQLLLSNDYFNNSHKKLLGKSIYTEELKEFERNMDVNIDKILENREQHFLFNDWMKNASKLITQNPKWEQMRSNALNIYKESIRERSGNEFISIRPSEREGYNIEKHSNSSNSSNDHIESRNIIDVEIKGPQEALETILTMSQTINENKDINLVSPIRRASTSKFEDNEGNTRSPENNFTD